MRRSELAGQNEPRERGTGTGRPAYQENVQVAHGIAALSVAGFHFSSGNPGFPSSDGVIKPPMARSVLAAYVSWRSIERLSARWGHGMGPRARQTAEPSKLAK